MKCRKTIIFCEVLMLFSFLFGCGSSTEKYTVEDTISQKLYEKYGFEVDISNLEDKSGLSYGDEGYKTCTATITDTGKSFNVNYFNKSKKIEDDYAANLFGEQIDERIQTIINEADSLTAVEYNFNYYNEEKAWKDISEIDEYLAESNSFLNVEISLKADDEIKAAKSIDTFRQVIEEQGMQYMLTCDFEIGEKQDEITIGNTKHLAGTSYDEILKKIQVEINE